MTKGDSTTHLDPRASDLRVGVALQILRMYEISCDSQQSLP
jgi:hypothetical protein